MIMPYSPTKKKIFEEAARLFAEKGYNVVTVREITSPIGLNESAIYRCYENKEDILNEIISEFSRKLKDYLLTPDKTDDLLKTDSPRQLLQRCSVDFQKGESEFMLRAFRIVCMEQFTNPKAREIVTTQLYRETAESIRYTLDKLAQQGDIPEYDRRFFSELWARSMFSDSMLWMYHLSDKEQADAASKEYHAANERMIDAALSGNLP